MNNNHVHLALVHQSDLVTSLMYFSFNFKDVTKSDELKRDSKSNKNYVEP